MIPADCWKLIMTESLLNCPAANLGNYMPREKASLLGLGAGILSWQGVSALANIAVQPTSVGLFANLASGIFGAVSVVLIRTVTQLQTKGEGTVSMRTLCSEDFMQCF